MELEALLKLANKAMFTIEEEHHDRLMKATDVFLKQVDMINEIDTTGVEPQDYPFVVVKTYLREDEVTHVTDREALLKNAKDVDSNQIKVPVVIKR